jgi:hypothetical protein
VRIEWLQRVFTASTTHLLSIMLRQNELAFLKALSSAQMSPALFRELRTMLAAAKMKKKRPTVPAGIKGTTSECGLAPSERSSGFTGKRKANEMVSYGDSSDPAIRRPAPGAGSAPRPVSPVKVTCEKPASGGRQLGSPEGATSYAAVVAAPVAPHPPSGPRTPTAKGLDLSEPAGSSEPATRRMSDDISGPMSGMPTGTTSATHVATTCVPAGERPNKTPIFITVVADTREFLACLRASGSCALTAQLKAEKLMVVPSAADGFRATVSALRPLTRGRVWVFTLSHFQRTALCGCW